MASRRYEAVEVTVAAARDLKNVNWRHGDLKPYVVAWIDPASKCSTGVSVDGDFEPVWDEKLAVPLPPSTTLEEAVLCLDVVHAGDAEDVKPLVGSARLRLRDVVEEAGAGGRADFSLKLKRPSGRPQGKLEVEIALKEPVHHYAPSPAAVGAYGYGQAASRGGYYGGEGGYGYAQPYAPATTATATAGYSYVPSPEYSYGAGGATAYGGGEEKKSKFGMGTGLAVGAAAGVVGGLALAEGVDYLEDKIADDVAERVEDDIADDGSFGGDDDDF